MSVLRSVLKDASASALVAGVISALVNYSGPFLIVLEATRAAGLNEAQTASWVWAVSIGNGVCSIALSLFTRMPIIVAWSTPGAALLIASLGGFKFSDAVGAFLVASIAAAVVGYTGWFGWLLDRVPAPVLQALLAGILLPFVISAGAAFQAAPILAGSVIVTYFVGKRYFDRYAVLAALIAGVTAAAVTGSFKAMNVGLTITGPVFAMPTFNLTALVSIGLPLFIVTMASQNAPGLALLRSEGYVPNDRLLVGSISTVSALLAPAGNHGINIAAITAAIAVGPESHHDRHRRYIAGLSAGAAYVLVGIFGSFLVAGFQSIPSETITTLAAVALLASTLTALKGATSGDARTGVSALTTLAVTMSGIVLISVGSAFWGLLAGSAVYVILGLPAVKRRPSRATSVENPDPDPDALAEKAIR
ncbi:benzoate/H(+) symporter BenE family transporter (plasmid) [Prescottella equi]|uniref:benzoate/H(+) symporter BenE family transporter n=1 Tax=Rhodococcus hoagii TaxID=43767 RepID=UPI002575A66A|nr:benzoate/H(+) symporter BenE family transporter [Prescottella equi]WJJ14624.1 benzoate/H(+) symporter BenE family transporter [Prescottella equi]